VDFFMLSGQAHPVSSKAGSKGARYVSGYSALDSDELRADALFPLLEWWALAHSRVILVRRRLSLAEAPSTYSGTAHLYGGWSNKHPGGHVAKDAI